jgi:hypothetical protein
MRIAGKGELEAHRKRRLQPLAPGKSRSVFLIFALPRIRCCCLHALVEISHDAVAIGTQAGKLLFADLAKSG